MTASERIAALAQGPMDYEVRLRDVDRQHDETEAERQEALDRLKDVA